MISHESGTFFPEGTFSQINNSSYLKAPSPILNLPPPSCYCTVFAERFGYELNGHAYQLQPNSDEPTVGGLILTREGPYGHVAVIYQIDFDSLIIVESNYVECKITYRRIPLDYKLIRGYIK
jgi:hypothetical protein